jgi:hypothetical protein
VTSPQTARNWYRTATEVAHQSEQPDWWDISALPA